MIFNQRYIDYLENQIKIKDERISALEDRLFEILDAKQFNRQPERLVNIPNKTPEVKQSTGMSDALSAAEQDAWERSKPKEERKEL